MNAALGLRPDFAAGFFAAGFLAAIVLPFFELRLNFQQPPPRELGFSFEKTASGS